MGSINCSTKSKISKNSLQNKTRSYVQNKQKQDQKIQNGMSIKPELVQIQQIHLKLCLLTIETFESARLELQKKGYIITNYISKGGQAEVFKGYSETLNRECAIRLSANTAKGYQSLLKEFKTIKHIKQPLNIVELIDVQFFEDIKICAHILELCQFSLEDEMQTLKNNNNWFDEQEQYFIIFSLCDALNEIQSYEIIHFDIKPSNVLKSMKGEYVLSDFGMSQKLQKNQYQINKVYGYSRAYISPEQLQNIQDKNEQKKNRTPINYSSDLYSMSILFLQVLGFKVDIFFNQNIREQKFNNIKLQENQKIIFEQFKKSLLAIDPNSRLKSLKLQKFFLKIFNIKNRNFLENYYRKIERILEQNKYNNSKNLFFSSQLHHEYTLTHLKISQILECKNKESMCLLNMGDSFQRLGKAEKALEYYQQSLEMRRSLNQGHHPDIATSLNNIALCYQALGKLDKALDYFHQSLKMYNSFYKGNHPDISTSLNNLGSCYETLGQLDKALEYHHQSLEMCRSLYKGNHPDIATSLNNLGGCYKTLGKTDKALEYLHETLKMYKSLYQGNHPQIATSLNNLGGCYETLGIDVKALKYFYQSLQMYKSLYQGNHPYIAMSLNNLGGYYETLGKLDEALQYFHQSLEMFKSLYKKNHPDIAISLNNLSSCYVTLGKPDLAYKYLQQYIEMKQSLNQ